MLVSLEPEKARKAIVKHLKNQFKDLGKDDSAFDERNMGKSLIDAAVNITTVAANLSSLVSPQNQIGIALLKLLTD